MSYQSHKSSIDLIMERFNEMHYKWRDGMDTSTYNSERRGTGTITRMHTFMDNDLARIGAELVDAGKASIGGVVAWLSNCDYTVYDNHVVVTTKSAFSEERTRAMFGVVMADLLKKAVVFNHSHDIKRRMEM